MFQQELAFSVEHKKALYLTLKILEEFEIISSKSTLAYLVPLSETAI
jgi:hypothetical protein